MGIPQLRGYFLTGGFTMARKNLVSEQADLEKEYHTKPNSRVTKKHIDQLLEAMDFATNNDTDGYQRLGYLSFAVSSVLKEVGYPGHYEAISKRMWNNYGKKEG